MGGKHAMGVRASGPVFITVIAILGLLGAGCWLLRVENRQPTKLPPSRWGVPDPPVLLYSGSCSMSHSGPGALVAGAVAYTTDEPPRQLMDFYERHGKLFADRRPAEPGTRIRGYRFPSEVGRIELWVSSFEEDGTLLELEIHEVTGVPSCHDDQSAS